MEDQKPQQAAQGTSVENISVENTNSPEEFGEIKFLSPSSRVGRIRYLSHLFLMAIPFYIVLGIAAALFVSEGDTVNLIGGILLAISYIALITISIIIMIQRLHDLNKSGWFSLLNLVPLANLFLAIYIIFWPGTKGPNKFGKRLPPNKTWNWVVAMVLPIVFFLGILAAIAIPAYQEYAQRSQATIGPVE